MRIKCTCVYQGIRDVSFSENSSDTLNKWSLCQLQSITVYVQYVILKLNFHKSFPETYLRPTWQIATRIVILWFIHGVKRVRIRSYSGPDFSRIFPHSDWIRRDTPYLSVFSPNAGKSGKNADQNNSEYGLFLCSAAVNSRSCCQY